MRVLSSFTVQQCREFDGSSPEVWTNRARHGFARLLHFGPKMLGGYTVNMLLRQGLAKIGQHERVVPDEIALAVWNAWVEERHRKSFPSATQKKTNMRFELI